MTKRVTPAAGVGSAREGALPPLWKLAPDEFAALAATGRIREATGVRLPDEREARTDLRRGEINGYPAADIAHYYVHMVKIFRAKFPPDLDPADIAWALLILDAAREGRDVPSEAHEAIRAAGICLQTSAAPSAKS